MISFSKINFRVARDVGQVYNTTFGFIRQNRSVIFKSVTYYIMPFILVSSFLAFNSMAGFFELVAGGKIDGNWWALIFSFLQLAVAFIMGYLTYATYITLMYEYMRLYMEADDPRTVTHREVWKATRKRFFLGFANVLVRGVLVGTLTTVVILVFYAVVAFGFVLSAIFNSPWIIVACYVFGYLLDLMFLTYIQVSTFPMLVLSAVDRLDIFTAFGRSFSMVNRKRNFWNAIGASLMGGLILLVLRYIVFAPLGVVIGIVGFNNLDATDLEPGGIVFNLIFKVLMPILTLLYYYTYTVYLVAEGFETFSLDERMNAKGLLAKIDKLGTYRDAGPEFYEVTY